MKGVPGATFRGPLNEGESRGANFSQQNQTGSRMGQQEQSGSSSRRQRTRQGKRGRCWRRSEVRHRREEREALKQTIWDVQCDVPARAELVQRLADATSSPGARPRRDTAEAGRTCSGRTRHVADCVSAVAKERTKLSVEKPSFGQNFSFR